eukprot:GILJ01004035.1.p2 GENE.GILJ01004035.1~~GILJ01004035.1.p2  ORF type:complete len:119 (+),score=11.02 GILJ01004035.1:305-661(+)
MKWLHLPLDGANQALLQSKGALEACKKTLPEVKRLLDAGESVLVHCAAGIHRTGVVVYSLHRMFGVPQDLARQALHACRMQTGKGVGEHRIEIAETLLLPFLLKECEADEPAHEDAHD